jgi:hypothetical protein
MRCTSMRITRVRLALLERLPMKTVAITITEYQGFQEAYDFFNRELFEGSLPQVLVTLQRHAKSRGYFSPERFSGRMNEAAVHELALNPDEFTGRTDEMILSTLAHEMAHVWQQTYGKPPRRGYHDRQWAGNRLTPIKIRERLCRFGLSKRKSFLIDKPANALHPRQLVRPDSASLTPYR